MLNDRALAEGALATAAGWMGKAIVPGAPRRARVRTRRRWASRRLAERPRARRRPRRVRHGSVSWRPRACDLRCVSGVSRERLAQFEQAIEELALLAVETRTTRSSGARSLGA